MVKRKGLREKKSQIGYNLSVIKAQAKTVT
jgi:hypothetical protein